MPTTSWSDAEDEALLGLSLLARVIYLQGLRRWMDYSTGIVGGPARRISRQMLAEIAYVEPVPGRHRNAAGAPSVKQIRNALDELERAGLIRRIGDAKSLIFELPLADVDKSAQKRMGRGRAEEGPTMMGREKPSNDAASGCMMGRGRADHNNGRMGPPPVSGIRKEPIVGRGESGEGGTGGEVRKPQTARAKRSPATRGSRLPPDWTLPPDWQAWALGHQPTWTPEHCLQVAESFRDYWIAKPGKDGIKLDWEATWRNWVRREKPMRAGPAPGHSSRAARNQEAIQAFLDGDPLETATGLLIDGDAKRVGT